MFQERRARSAAHALSLGDMPPGGPVGEQPAGVLDRELRINLRLCRNSCTRPARSSSRSVFGLHADRDLAAIVSALMFSVASSSAASGRRLDEIAIDQVVQRVHADITHESASTSQVTGRFRPRSSRRRRAFTSPPSTRKTDAAAVVLAQGAGTSVLIFPANTISPLPCRFVGDAPSLDHLRRNPDVSHSSFACGPRRTTTSLIPTISTSARSLAWRRDARGPSSSPPNYDEQRARNWRM